MIDAEKRALETIEKSVNLVSLRKLLDNARGVSGIVEKAAFRRIVALSSSDQSSEVARDCWSMIYAVEELRRLERGRKSPMNRLRPKIAREGEVAALEYLALHKSDGFQEVVDYGCPDLLAEAIVIRHGTPPFSERAVEAAKARLAVAGLAQPVSETTILN